MNISDWKPASVDEVQQTVRDDLARCDAGQHAALERYGVEPYVASILRYGNWEPIK